MGLNVLVSVVGRRMGGGFKVAELFVIGTSHDDAERDAQVKEAATKWAAQNGLELKLWEVLR